jgi:hypothetical protein
MFCYWTYLVFTRQWPALTRLTSIGFAALLFGFLVIGASTYAKNIYTNGHPLYPLMGKGSVNFIPIEELDSYQNDPGFYKFIKANLSQTIQINHELSLQQGEPGAKIPFSVTADEVSRLDAVDIRQGGYGVWFGGVLILTFMAGIYLLIDGIKRYKKYLPLFILPITALALSVLLLDTTWWARYLPHLAVVPVVITLGLYLREKVVLANILVFAMLFNVVLYALIGASSQSKFQQQVRQSFDQHITCRSEQPTRIFSASHEDGLLYNIKDHCSNIHIMSPEEFKSTDERDRVELIKDKGLYIVENRQTN